MSLSSSSFGRVNDMACSGGPGGPELKGRGQAAHLDGVARIGAAIARALKEEVPQFDVDLNEVIAGGLCHDLGKAWEYDPNNRERCEADHRITGLPSLRHPLFGVHVALTAGLPEQIAHIAGTHSAEGEHVTRSLAGEIVAIADHTFWRLLRSDRLLEEPSSDA